MPSTLFNAKTILVEEQRQFSANIEWFQSKFLFLFYSFGQLERDFNFEIYS